MRIGLVAAVLLVLAAGCSHAKPAEGPYSSADVRWLVRFARWDDEYTRKAQPIQDTFRDVLGARQPLRALKDAVEPLRECGDTLMTEVRRPDSERLRRAYDLLLNTCAEDPRFADALVGQALTPTEEERKTGADSSESSQRSYESARRVIEGGLRANRTLPTRGGSSTESRIEPRLSRAASVLVLRKVQVRCWSASEWRSMVREWDAYSGTETEVSGFVNGSTRINIEPSYCRTLARFVYERWRPSNDDEAILDAADAVDLLAHESQHLFNPNGDEPETECHGLQDVRRLAILLGASRSYAAELARVDWEDLYPGLDPDYQTADCGPNQLFDLRPETPGFPD